MNFKNFAIEFHTGNKSAMSRRNAQDESFNYTGPVHTLDEVHPYITLAHFQAFLTMNLFKTIYAYYCLLKGATSGKAPLPRFWVSIRSYKKRPVKKKWGRILGLVWLKFVVTPLLRTETKQ